ncbi:hypothetical protein [Marinomonas transparens]|uniref:Uncharacterized protein n=1 Tax=Marinomonas transparens TaxID=2795388 RepID=A0A934N3Q4_9GAMM|nr:hypothetical protein [Marinomonas transparens]MBJ7539258.1 hypothetical protein [Marinomonas transparens]
MNMVFALTRDKVFKLIEKYGEPERLFYSGNYRSCCAVYSDKVIYVNVGQEDDVVLNRESKVYKVDI